MSAGLRIPVGQFSAALSLGLLLGLPLVAGEKANITPSATQPTPSNLNSPKGTIPFRPLDGTSSIGGVMDGGSGTALPTVDPAVPDARTQMEILERLDRKRNFLLLDNSTKMSAESGPFGSGSGQGDDQFLLSPRRPQSALEKRLRMSNEPQKVEIPDRKSESVDSKDSDNQSGLVNLDGLGVFARSPASSEVLVEAETSFGASRKLSSFGSEEGIKPTTLDDLRSSVTPTGARGLGLDALSLQRLERYQHISGGGDSLRQGLAPDPAELGRSRALRSDSVEAILSPPPNPISSSLLDPAPASTDLVTASGRPSGSGLISPFSGVQPNPYASTPTFTPEISPAARLLKEPRPEPPRFRQ